VFLQIDLSSQFRPKRLLRAVIHGDLEPAAKKRIDQVIHAWHILAVDLQGIVAVPGSILELLKLEFILDSLSRTSYVLDFSSSLPTLSELNKLSPLAEGSLRTVTPPRSSGKELPGNPGLSISFAIFSGC